MIHYDFDPAPYLALTLVAAVGWYVRKQRSARSEVRLRQLADAEELLRMHATSLERFLDDPDAPRELKGLLIDFSDSMNEPEVVQNLAEWIAARRLDRPIETDEMKAVGAAIAELRSRRPDLVEEFDTAIITAVSGANLRWPESAALFESVFPRIVATQKRDVAIAVTVTRLRPGVLFSIRPTPTAMA
jgi:hypothetical protein